jgi:putative flippase GtrA
VNDKLRTRATSALQQKRVRYIVTGLTNFFIEYALFAVLIGTTHMLYLANSISYGVGVSGGFILHKFWSFAGEQELRTHHQAVVFAVLAGINFVATNVIIGLLAHGMHINALLAKLVALCIIICWNYIVLNVVIFRQKRPKSS